MLPFAPCAAMRCVNASIHALQPQNSPMTASTQTPSNEPQSNELVSDMGITVLAVTAVLAIVFVALKRKMKR